MQDDHSKTPADAQAVKEKGKRTKKKCNAIMQIKILFVNKLFNWSLIWMSLPDSCR